MSVEGPVVIDFPQAVDAASNQNARKLLLRDVENLKRCLSRFAPDRRPGAYAEEMWDLYATSLLTPETRLTGRHRPSEQKANTAAVLDLIGDASLDERKRRERQGLGMRGVPAAPARPASRAGSRPPHSGPRGAPPSLHATQRPSSPPRSQGHHAPQPPGRPHHPGHRAPPPAPGPQPAEANRPQQHGPRRQASAQQPSDAQQRPGPRPPQPPEQPRDVVLGRRVVISVNTWQQRRGSRRNP
ncbi:MAG: RIO1 family regulatory kinase/ATPase [Polyangiaceae bacterium]